MYVTRTSPAPKHVAQDRPSMTGAPLPYRQEDLMEKPVSYREEVRGIVPGYAGHVPRAQHKYSGTHFGPQAIIKDSSPEKALVAQDRHPNTKEKIELGKPYRELVGGIVPGYAGHVPKSAFTYGVSAQGATEPFTNTSPTRQSRGGSDDFLERLIAAERSDMLPIQPGNPLGSEGGWWPESAPAEATSPSFRNKVNGVVPGYAGHVPLGQYKTGEPMVGQMPRGMPNTDHSKLSSTGMPDTKGSAAYIVPALGSDMKDHTRIDEGPILPGYSGYVPGARMKVGTSTYWTEDGKKFAGKHAGESTEDNDRQNAKDMGLDSFGAVGFDESDNPLDS